ncbi:MAG: hypothetical protein HY228_00095 [Candidatus Yonathbacteria bacterium]|nr:hypothetical protein [Candidatus Yonathbacteria bacterium]
MKSFLRHIIIIILEMEAKLVLRKYKPKIIAVTGSVGKTSTKDAIFAIAEQMLIVRKNIKSFNSEIGIPLTILGCDNAWSNPFAWLSNIFSGFALVALREHYPKWLILEIGARKPGDIKRISSWVIPDIAVVTRFSDVPSHIEFFKSAEDLFEDKTEIVKALKTTGVLVLNADDERVLALRGKIKARSITFGFSEEAMFRASNVQIVYGDDDLPIGTTFKFEYQDNTFPVVLYGVLGTQAVYSALAALTVGIFLKINIVDMIEFLARHKSPPGRMMVIQGIKDTMIIDDTYNSSPVAAHAALEVLSTITTKGKKIAVLGDMLELGKFTAEEHKKLGALAGKQTDILFAVGLRAKHIVEGALGSGMSEKKILEFTDARTAGKYLEGMLSAGDVVLVKGSQSMRMERAVEEVMAHPEDAPDLLVRQEEEWLSQR